MWRSLSEELAEMERTDPELRSIVERHDLEAWRAKLRRTIRERYQAFHEAKP